MYTQFGPGQHVTTMHSFVQRNSFDQVKTENYNEIDVTGSA